MFEDIENPLDKGDQEGWKKIVQAGGILVYLLVLFLTLAHNYNLIVNGVAQDVKWIATVGVVALELNAIILPLAIHHWTSSSWHKSAAITFYIIDLAILFANSIIDAKMVRGGTLSPVALWYLDNFAAASPLYSLVVWSTLWILDPVSRAKEKMNKMVAHSQMSAINQVDAYIKSAEFMNVVAKQGDKIGKYVLSQAFKGQMFDTPDKENEPIPELEEIYSSRPKSNGNGKAKNF